MKTTAEAPGVQVPVSALRVWVPVTAMAALTMTTLDAVLLQLKKSFFTGGFLAGTHAASASETVGFLAASVLVDLAVIGPIVGLVLWLTGGLRLTRLARLFLTLSASLGPILLWTFVSYSLITYLGDAFDLDLMFDLVGRRPSEILAVASSHLVMPAVLVAGAGAAVGTTTWLLNRLDRRQPRARVRVSRRFAAVLIALLFVGMAGAAAASAVSDLLEDGLRRKASGQLYTRVTERITDVDRDGFGVGARTSDPAPFDATIYPYALDVPGNAIDEDAVGGDFPAGQEAYVERSPLSAAWRQRPDVVLVVLESFRADVLGQLVGGRPVTPVLDALAREGISSGKAFSHNGYTTQSRFHLFTGSLAGLRSGSLIDDFKANGYETAYFSAQDESFGGPRTGVGFDRADIAYDARQDRDRRYSTFSTAGSLAVSHARLRERIDDFLASRDSARPLFLYVNFHDTHYPYHHRDIAPLVSSVTLTQSQIVPARRDALHEMYLNTAANVDQAIGATLDAVTRATGATPAVIVTADHGESLFDEGFLGHGYALNDVQTRIPLIVRGLPVEIEEPFGQADLREALGRALSGDAGTAPAPRIVANGRKAVFQYLGDIHRPRQIARADGAGRLTYDFRIRQVRLPDGRTSAPDALEGRWAAEFLRLVHDWERMMLARGARARSPAE